VSKILVTGASGFIGSRLCQRLLAAGHEVHGTSRIPRSSYESKSAFQWHWLDPGNYDSVRKILGTIRPQIVFHLASRVTGSRDLSEVIPVFQANLATAVNVLVSATEECCGRVILAGSMEEPAQLDGACSCSPYAAAKWSGTAYAAMFHSLFHASVVVPRIFMTYGPGQRDLQKLIPYTIMSMLDGKVPLLSSGTRLIDWIFIDDVVEGLTKVAFADEIEDLTFDLGSGSLTSIRAVVEQIAEIIGNGVKPQFAALPDRPLERERVADVALMERTFQWKPSKALRDGLRETVDWYRREMGHTQKRAAWA
jgi:UDP-glucose 4-epimerase